MKYFSMLGHINEEMSNKFIDFANHNSEEKWCIVLNTAGGSYFVTELFIRMINSHSDVMVIVQGAYSSGMMLLANLKCKIVLSKTCRGMWHYGKWSLEMSDKSKPYYLEDECILKNMPFHKRQTEALARKIMTSKEYKDFKDDKDVYFDFQRMKQIFPDAEVMK